MIDALVFNNSYVYYLNFYPSSGFTRSESLAAVCDVKLGTESCNVLIPAFLSQERRPPFMNSVVASCWIPQECWTQVQTIVDLRGTQRRKRGDIFGGEKTTLIPTVVYFLSLWMIPSFIGVKGQQHMFQLPLLFVVGSVFRTRLRMWILDPHDLTLFICETLGTGLSLSASQFPHLHHGEIRTYV